MVRLWLAKQLAPFALLAVIAGCMGCKHVAPYERESLARPDMTTADLAGLAVKHATAVHEGATRGGSVAESGCGCN